MEELKKKTLFVKNLSYESNFDFLDHSLNYVLSKLPRSVHTKFPFLKPDLIADKLRNVSFVAKPNEITVITGEQYRSDFILFRLVIFY